MGFKGEEFQSAVKEGRRLGKNHFESLYYVFQDGKYTGSLGRELTGGIKGLLTGLKYALKYDVVETAIRHPKIASKLIELSGTKNKIARELADYLQASMEHEYREPLQGLVEDTYPVFDFDRRIELSREDDGFALVVYKDGTVVVNPVIDTKGSRQSHLARSREEVEDALESDVRVRDWKAPSFFGLKEVPWNYGETGDNSACRVYYHYLDKLLDFAFGQEETGKPELEEASV